MEPKRNLTLTTKLALAIVITGLIPAIITGLLALRTASQMAGGVGENCELIARNISDMIDRNLFERYGDVQAFGANEAVNDQKSWYQVGSEKNKLAAAANRYANLYGFYQLSYVVDLEGRVIAVNDKDPGGKPIDTAWLYQKNFKDTEWFQASLAGRFHKSDSLDGTYLQDLHADEDVKRVYAGDGLVLGFSAPFKDAAGKVIGVWHNCANFSLVEEIVANAYQHFKQTQCPAAELTLVDHKGRVLVDYDPTLSGKEAVQHDLSVILKLNLAEKGLKSVQDLVAGKGGHGRYVHVRKQVAQVNGYAVCSGALGFPSFKWGVLVRVPEQQALAVMRSQLLHIAIILAVSVAGLVGMGWWLGRSITLPIKTAIEAISISSEQTASASGQVTSASQSLAAGASEQAASIEETSASLEEMASMTKRNAEGAHKANELARQTRTAAEEGAANMSQMSAAMEAIKASSDDISKILKTIDEIAFQTNILALNAAVEAARAGEAGMGFAVVADEVRALAQRSAKAAKETAEKIEGAISKTAQGVDISGKVAATLDVIVTKARHMDELAAEVAGASREQTQGITQINLAVGQMDKVTQSNAANAEESAAAAEELNSQAHVMKEAVISLQQLCGLATDGVSTAARSVSTPARSAARQNGAEPQHAKANGHFNARAKPIVAKGPATAAPRLAEIPMGDEFKEF